MKKLKLISLLLFVSVTVYSQNKKLDSLWSVYNNKSQVDTNRLKALRAIVWSYNSNNPDTAIILANKLKASAAEFGNKKFVAIANNIIGISFLNKGDYLKALSYSSEGLKVSEEINCLNDAANCYINIGLIYFYQANFPKALDYSLRALKMKEKVGDKKGACSCSNNIGNIYKEQFDYAKALKYYSNALNIRIEINDKSGIASCYNNIGIIYSIQLNYTKALAYFFKAIKLNEELNEKKAIADCYNNIGNSYLSQYNFQQALIYFFKSLQIRKEIDDKYGVGTCYNNLGGTYNGLLNFKSAILYCDSGLQIAKEIEDLNGQQLSYSNLAISYSKIGNYKEAYNYHVKFATISDSIFNEENSQQLSDLKTNFEVERKEVELKTKAELEKTVIESQHKRKQLIAAFMVLFVILIASFLLNRQKLKTKKDKIIFEQQEALLQSEKQKIEEELLNAKKLLTNYTENLIEKNSAIEGFKTEIEKLKGLKSTEIYNEKIEVLDDLSSSTILTNEDWDKFKNLFDQVYKGFFVRLKDKFATLTNAETRLMSLIKLNLDTKQMANMLGVSPETITKTRYRLKKKLNLNEGDSLEKVVESI